MSTLSYSTAVVLIQPPETWPPIQAIHYQHDQKVRRWMPRVTVIYPNEAPLAMGVYQGSLP